MRKTLVFFLLVLTICTPAWTGGKISYGTGHGIGLKVTIPFGPSDTVRVKNVMDGDTIELEDGRLVRYLEIDTPELRHRERGIWVYDPQPFSEEAAALNRKLVEGKQVRLEFDQQKRDRFGRLLAYVFVKMDVTAPATYDGEVFLDSHEIFVNAYLLREGVARLLIIPPNRRYARHLERVEAQARKARRNLWAAFKTTQGEMHAGQR